MLVLTRSLPWGYFAQNSKLDLIFINKKVNINQRIVPKPRPLLSRSFSSLLASYLIIFSRIVSPEVQLSVINPHAQKSPSIMLTIKYVCPIFFAIKSLNQTDPSFPKYVANTMISQIPIKINPPIHSQQIIFFFPLVSPPLKGNKFTIKVAIDKNKVNIPTVIKDPLNEAVHSQARNKKGQAKLPGALLYLKAQSNYPNNVMMDKDIKTMLSIPTNLCTTLLLAQLFASPIPPRATIIQTPANMTLTPQKMKKIFRLKTFLILRTRIAIKLMPSKIQEIGNPMVVRV